MLVTMSVAAPSQRGKYWFSTPSSLLICGRDTTLLWTRKVMLQHAGIPVETMVGTDGFVNFPLTALILCHTLSDRERKRAIRRHHARLGGARILVLAGSGKVQPCGDCEWFTYHCQPHLFIQKVRFLVAASELKAAH